LVLTKKLLSCHFLVVQENSFGINPALTFVKFFASTY